MANLGHGIREVADAMANQARKIAYVNATAFTNHPAEELASAIAARCPGDLDKVYFLSSGSEAVEAALKLTRQYWSEHGSTNKRTIVALSPSYHGNTLLALSASARDHYKTFFHEWLIKVVRTPAPMPYRCPCKGEAPLCSTCSGTKVEEAIHSAGPENVAAVILEPIGGSSTGASVPPHGFHRHVRDLCDRHDILYIADEVLTGVGRTGAWTAGQHFDVAPDILILGKGLTGGYAPLSAVVAPTRIIDVLASGSGRLLHAQTFSHHPVSCAAGLAAIQYLETHGLLARCAELGPTFHEHLKCLRQLPHVGDVRGRGLLAGIEFVQDKGTRAPIPRDAKFSETFVEAARRTGIIVWPNVGHVDGVNGDLVCLAPPFVITTEQMDEIVQCIEAALTETVQRVFGLRMIESSEH